MNDNVNEPAHYTSGQIECIDAIKEALGDIGFMAYCKGNVLKYLWRAGKKGDAREDLEKANVYLGWLLDTALEEEDFERRATLGEQMALDPGSDWDPADPDSYFEFERQAKADRVRCRELLNGQEDLPF